MAGSDTPIKERDPIGGLTSILDLYSGKKTVTTDSPTTTTESTKSNLTADMLNNQIDMAMAPLNQASHASGLSTYSDTTLALGRGQVAADIAAKNAGTTRTVTTSGGTRTTETPGALSGSRSGDTAQSLLMNQILMPTAKRVLNPLTTGISDAIGKGADSIIGSILGGGGADVGAMAAVDASGASTDVLGDFIAGNFGNTVGAGVTSGAGDALSGIGDTVAKGASDAFDWVKNLLDFAEGGYVDSDVDADGYATGGFVDTHVSRSNLQSNFSDPKISASGDIGDSDIIDPRAAPKSATNPILSAAGGGSRNGKSDLPNTDPQPNDTSGNAPITAANIAMSMAGMINPILGMILSSITGAASVPGVIAGNMINASDNNFNNNFNKEVAVGPNPEPKTDTNATESTDPQGMGTIGGESTTSMATGGQVRGPGTGTSDSVSAHLSDGEYVIDAKTVAALGPEFFQAIQAKFNPEAIASQSAKGRI